ncbi:MAG: hypothetical protein D3926_03800 [Desulfobacteraceae bacterium]|nr:MAG: hypothetical protein D3926_03800 [Desulfobacteraceae bacterium]
MRNSCIIGLLLWGVLVFADPAQSDFFVIGTGEKVGTPIHGLPYTISQPGMYYLTGNRSTTGHGITVKTSHVTIDLMGYTITGPGMATPQYGIFVDQAQMVEVRNGWVRNFSHGFYSQNDDEWQGHRLIHLKITDTGYGANLSGIGNMVIHCQIMDNGYGVIGSNGTVFKHNVFSGNTVMGLSAGGGSLVKGNTIQGNSFGIMIALESLVLHNTVTGNDIGIKAEQSFVLDNTITENDTASEKTGLVLKEYNLAAGNLVSGNTTYNIRVQSDQNPPVGGNAIKDNVMTGATGYGLYFETTGNFYDTNKATANSGGNFRNTTGNTSGGGNWGGF